MTTILRTSATVGTYEDVSRSVPILASTPNAPGDGQPAITTWDLERFAKNPIVLWAHDQEGENLPIGTATSISVDGEGLKAVVRFASERANPLAEQVWQLVREGIQRAVSVGYEIVGGGVGRLLEISFVPIGLDEDAGTPDLNDEAANQRADGKEKDPYAPARDALEKALASLPKAGEVPAPDEHDEVTTKRLSEAARMLSKHRSRLAAKRLAEAAKAVPKEKPEKDPVPDTDPMPAGMGGASSGPVSMSLRSDAAENEDVSELRADADLEKFERTQAGGRIIPARLSRVGVLRYLQPDGTYRRELRLPEEVFKADSMRSLEHANVVDFRDHRSLVDTASFKRATLGTTANVRREGKYLVGELRIDDAGALDAIANDERKDVSLGYRCRLDWTAGVYEGEPYDCVQRDITYNHTALCPPNRGRAGPDVGLRLDVGEKPITGGVARIDVDDTTIPEGDSNMSTTSIATPIVKVRYDGKEVVEFSPEHFALVNAQLEKFRSDAADLSTKLDAATKRADAAEGERDGMKSEIATLRTDAEEEKAKKTEAAKEKERAERNFVKARRKLERATLRYFSGPDDDDDDDGDKDEKAKKAKRAFSPAKDDDGDDDKDEKAKKAKKSMRSDGADDDRLTDERLDAMSDRELMIWAIQKVDSRFDGKDSDGNERSEDYVRARFDAAVETRKSSRSIHGVVRAHEALRRSEHFDADDSIRELAEARKKRDADAANAWKTTPATVAK